jgi:hypothetical protein
MRRLVVNSYILVGIGVIGSIYAYYKAIEIHPAEINSGLVKEAYGAMLIVCILVTFISSLISLSLTKNERTKSSH